MNTKFRRHEKVRLIISPLESDIESYEEETPSVSKGTIGEVNLLLPNGRYHVAIKNEKGEKLAFVVADEEALESIPNQELSHNDEEDINTELKEAHKTKSKKVKK